MEEVPYGCQKQVYPTVRTDMLKVRLSDNTLLAATYGRGMYTAIIPATPEVRFIAPSLRIQKQLKHTFGCRYFKDYTVNVSMVFSSAGDATVTYNVQAGDTAIQGSDFDFTTNGNFTSPSNQPISLQMKMHEQRFLRSGCSDDAQIEPSETFTVACAVSGATDAIHRCRQ